MSGEQTPCKRHRLILFLLLGRVHRPVRIRSGGWFTVRDSLPTRCSAGLRSCVVHVGEPSTLYSSPRERQRRRYSIQTTEYGRWNADSFARLWTRPSSCGMHLPMSQSRVHLRSQIGPDRASPLARWGASANQGSKGFVRPRIVLLDG